VTQPMPQEQKPTVLATAQPGSRLEQLLAQYDTAKAESEEAVARFKAITTALKAEASAMCPGAEDIALSGAPSLPRLRLSWRRPWRFNTDKFKEEQPYLYVKYSEQGGHWELRVQQ
jgi:hypothetical protein